ncbi:hypothetical protein Taro_051879, partial [Colocasia esculenta]|nr:hypothetical protein [Colocasia esculenta]
KKLEVVGSWKLWQLRAEAGRRLVRIWELAEAAGDLCFAGSGSVQWPVLLGDGVADLKAQLVKAPRRCRELLLTWRELSSGGFLFLVGEFDVILLSSKKLEVVGSWKLWQLRVEVGRRLVWIWELAEAAGDLCFAGSRSVQRPVLLGDGVVDLKAQLVKAPRRCRELLLTWRYAGGQPPGALRRWCGWACCAGSSGQLRWRHPDEVALVCWVRCKREAGAGCAERRGVLCAMRSWACAMEEEDLRRL